MQLEHGDWYSESTILVKKVKTKSNTKQNASVCSV